MRAFRPWLAAATAACAIDAGTPNALCVADEDCAAPLACVADLTAGKSYCAAGCALDADCLPHQRCRLGVAASVSMAIETRVCVDRVRACAMEEICNGLDDDCDGVIDDGCTPRVGCLDDAVCGAFVCSAPENQPTALCVAPSGGRDDLTPCAADADCKNALCESGLCSPLCRGDVVGAAMNPCPSGFTCARGVGPRSRPAHNLCQKNCLSPRDCAAGQICAWRDVFQSGFEHQFVCTKPGPGRSPLGAACSANSLAGDDECESGLCFEFRCTRPCGGAGSTCTDVGPQLGCRTHQLIYGDREFMVDICANQR